MKTGDLVEPEEFHPGYYHTTTENCDGWIGVVTRIINDNMEPSLVEVAWAHGEVLKHFADDLRPLSRSKEIDGFRKGN